MKFRIQSLVAAAAFAVAGVAQARLVFSSDFNSVTADVNANTALLTGEQGYAGLGQPGNRFGGQFLRSATANKVTLTLLNLPTHDALSVQFLFAAIDSLDGTGAFPSGDYFRIDIDGVNRFRAGPAELNSSMRVGTASEGEDIARENWSKHEQKTAPYALGGLQGQGGAGRRSRRRDAGRVGAAA